MDADNYSISQLAADVKRVCAEFDDERQILSHVRPLARRAALSKSTWLEDRMYQADATQGFGVHLIHEEPDHTIAILALSLAAGPRCAATRSRHMGGRCGCRRAGEERVFRTRRRSQSSWSCRAEEDRREGVRRRRCRGAAERHDSQRLERDGQSVLVSSHLRQAHQLHRALAIRSGKANRNAVHREDAELATLNSGGCSGFQ